LARRRGERLRLNGAGRRDALSRRQAIGRRQKTALRRKIRHFLFFRFLHRLSTRRKIGRRARTVRKYVADLRVDGRRQRRQQAEDRSRERKYGKGSEHIARLYTSAMPKRVKRFSENILLHTCRNDHVYDLETDPAQKEDSTESD
jgi:hypothetical protein